MPSARVQVAQRWRCGWPREKRVAIVAAERAATGDVGALFKLALPPRTPPQTWGGASIKGRGR
eukprot:8435375-Lingulodinium_polyedra.AAC.1